MLSEIEKQAALGADYFGTRGLGINQRRCPVGAVSQLRGAKFTPDSLDYLTCRDKESDVIVSKVITDVAEWCGVSRMEYLGLSDQGLRDALGKAVTRA